MEPDPDALTCISFGYLVGDRFVSEEASIDPDPAKIAEQSERVHLVEDGLDRFLRVRVGRAGVSTPLIYDCLWMPSASDDIVRDRFLNGGRSVEDVTCVTPALDAAFRMEVWRRDEANRRRAEIEAAERRRQFAEQLGSAEGRRALAEVDFERAARAALAVSGAVYLDSRNGTRAGEKIVIFRWLDRRFECVCDARTLRIIDSGICLRAENARDGFAVGTRGDDWFVLESLPGVIREADAVHRLVVFRHADTDYDDDD